LKSVVLPSALEDLDRGRRFYARQGKTVGDCASVSTRLLNPAKRSGADYQRLLTTDRLERYICRLGA
jgi:hypothetical protein